MPAARSRAQIEASRRDSARSKGPITREGKARASRNALKHGLTAMEHLVPEDQMPGDLEDLIETESHPEVVTGNWGQSSWGRTGWRKAPPGGSTGLSSWRRWSGCRQGRTSATAAWLGCG